MLCIASLSRSILSCFSCRNYVKACLFCPEVPKLPTLNCAEVIIFKLLLHFFPAVFVSCSCTPFFESCKLCLFCKRDQVFRDNCFSLEKSGIGFKKLEKMHLKPFLTSFQFILCSLCIDQNFSSTGLPLCSNRFI